MAEPSFSHNSNININISDIMDVIREDYQDTNYDNAQGSILPRDDASDTYSNASLRNDPNYQAKCRATIKILEQPASKALRFRYICEGRSAGSIPGVHSTTENKTFPSIQVMGYKGAAVAVVSCVTVDPPYRPHPHNLVGKEGCTKGVCTMRINNDSMQVVFSNLGIQCIKKRDVEEALRLREEIRVDPFQTGFSHRNQPQSIDLNAVRLCFQVFLEGSEKENFNFPLKPVVSSPIYDKKAATDLIICKLSDCTSSVAGGKEIILLCDKVTKEDIQVRFYEVRDGKMEWEAFGDFQASDVHKQVAISFKTPKYKSLEIGNPVNVFVQLLRPSDKATSEPRPFQYLPLDSDPDYVKRKVAKLENSNADKIARFVTETASGLYGDVPITNLATGAVPRQFIQATRTKFNEKIKKEPQDITAPGSPLLSMIRSPPSQHYGGGTLYTVSNPSPSPIPSGMYYQPPAQSEAIGGPIAPSPGIPDRRVSSPGQPYYHIPDAQSPYSQDPGMGAAGPANIGYSPSVASPPQAAGATSHLFDLDSKKCVEHNNMDLLDVNINSAELRMYIPSESEINVSMVDTHLSENLSSNLNLIDTPSLTTNLNKLSSKSGAGVSNVGSLPFPQNIPVDPILPNAVGSTTSDSFNNLKSEIDHMEPNF